MCGRFILLFLIGVSAAVSNDVSKTTITTTTGQPITSSSPPTTLSTLPPTPPPTTTAPITTTVKPKNDFWVVEDATSKIKCIIATMKIHIEVPYNDSSIKAKVATVEVPGNSTASGTCNSSNSSIPQKLHLQWGNTNASNWIEFTFTSNNDSSKKNESSYKHFWISSVEASLNIDNTSFPNITGDFNTVKLHNVSRFFVTPLGVSYSCSPATKIPAVEDPLLVNSSATFTLSNVQIEAFRTTETEKFSSSIYCENGVTPDLVPILVGCALIALVLIVLVAYLISRRRSMARGYLSM